MDSGKGSAIGVQGSRFRVQGLTTGETITVASQKGTVSFSSRPREAWCPNWDSPPLIHSPVLSVALGALACLFAASSASAHSLYISAHVEGKMICGRAYFRGNTPAQNVQIIARDPADQELGRTTTNEQGEFRLEAHSRVDHKLLVDTGDGHGDQCTVSAKELPASLPSVGQIPDVPGQASNSPASPAATAAAEPDAPAPTGSQPAADQIDELRREVIALREQVDGYQQQTQFRDILGGIGFIVGATGVAYYVLAMKRKG